MTGKSAVSLLFERDDPCNTTIIDHGGNIIYTVVTESPIFGRRVTRVHDGARKLVAEWKSRYARSDMLTIRDRRPTPVSDWLKRSYVPFRNEVKFLHAGTEYIWKNKRPGPSLQLFSPQSKTPVSRFIRKHKEYKISLMNPPVVPSTLLLDESVEPIRDIILVSFLLLEHQRRESQRASINQGLAAASMAQAASQTSASGGC